MIDPIGLAGVRVLVLSSGKAGHEINCLGVAEALGVPYEIKVVAPRPLYARLAPFGPADRRDLPNKVHSQCARIFLACGRVTVPYIRTLKRAAPDKTFAVFLQDPVASRGTFDLIWAPEHDRLNGPNVFATLTSPHPFGARRLAKERLTIDPRVAALTAPRAAILLGGPSNGYEFKAGDLAALSEATRAISAQGYSVMATPSRRTPVALVEAIRKGLGERGGFIWDGTGQNPYPQILAHANAILVTGDSVNMVGEAAATGAPVYVFEPSGGARRTSHFIAEMEARGAVRRFFGRLEPFSYAPIDSSQSIAAEIARRFADFRARRDNAATRPSS